MIVPPAALESKGREEVARIKADNFINIDVDTNARDGGGGDDEAARNKEEAAALQQLMLLQVNQALLRDQQANAAQKELDNVLRAAALAQREQEKSTVIVVVTTVEVVLDIEVQVDNDKKEKRKIATEVFKQEAVVANRGKQETQTVMGKNFDIMWAGPCLLHD